MTDLAGNVAVFTQTVRLDTTGPAIAQALSGGTNVDLGAASSFTYAASDVSGVASTSTTLDGATSVASGAMLNLYTLTAGTHTIVVRAVDGAGNVSTVTVSFALRPTILGLVNAVAYGVAQGAIAKNTGSSLTTTLQSAQSALARGDATAARGYLNSFISQVRNGAASKLTPSYGALLVDWAQDVLGR